MALALSKITDNLESNQLAELGPISFWILLYSWAVSFSIRPPGEKTIGTRLDPRTWYFLLLAVAALVRVLCGSWYDEGALREWIVMS